MSTVPDSVPLEGARFVGRNLRGARFVESDLSGVVMRGVDVQGADIDAPWLPGGVLLVNGVDVASYVEAELDRRHPGRDRRRAEDPEGLRAAWASLRTAWTALVERALAMPEGTVDRSVDGEWTFSQTLRHLVLATDSWLGKAVLGREQPFHPLGQPRTGAEEDGLDLSLFTSTTPPFAEVLAAREDRVATMRAFLDAVTREQLAEARANPWDPQYPETVLTCVQVVLEEEWEHLRYAERDLDALAAGPADPAPQD
ncbi:DinB family protein [Pseudokineococcus sp. 1T1Z-3]|uniref:DinB family protein n=1 Tax=Pseudokineococcus sp. 1T1Z-3 TaxID=3132745 RepID=UPI00309FFB3B